MDHEWKTSKVVLLIFESKHVGYFHEGRSGGALNVESASWNKWRLTTVNKPTFCTVVLAYFPATAWTPTAHCVKCRQMHAAVIW